MNKKLTLVLPMFVLFGWNCFAQEAEWEPQKHITGYASTEFDYFKGIQYFKRDHAINLTEAGLLCTYQPLQRLTIKGIFVYRPNYAFNDMLNELNCEWKFGDWLQVQGGRFLTPLSPVNTNYYAVANTAISLPLMVTSHECYPVSMNGLALKGFIGDNIKLNYNVFGGGYFTSMYLPTGSLGLFGQEATYFQFWGSLVPISDHTSSTLQTGGGGHIGISLADIFVLGGGTFYTKEDLDFVLPTGDFVPMKLKGDGFCLNSQFKYKTLKLSAEYWEGYGSSEYGKVTIKASCVELCNSFFENKITPYLRFEDHYSTNFIFTPSFSRYTAGINYRPIFEITLKAEYLHYKNSQHDLDGLIGALIFSF